MGKVSSKESLPSVSVPPIVCVCCRSQYRERVDHYQPKVTTSPFHETLGEPKVTTSPSHEALGEKEIDVMKDTERKKSM